MREERVHLKLSERSSILHQFNCWKRLFSQVFYKKLHGEAFWVGSLSILGCFTARSACIFNLTQAFLHSRSVKDSWPQTSSITSIRVLWKNSAEELRKVHNLEVFTHCGNAGSWRACFTNGRGACGRSTLTSRDLSSIRVQTWDLPWLPSSSFSETPVPTVTEKELIYADSFSYPKQPWDVYSKYHTLVRFYWSLFSQTPLQLLLSCLHSCVSATWKQQMLLLLLSCIPEAMIIFTVAVEALPAVFTALALRPWWEPGRAKGGTRALSLHACREAFSSDPGGSPSLVHVGLENQETPRRSPPNGMLFL